MTKIATEKNQDTFRFDDLFDLWIHDKSIKVRNSTLAIYRCHIKAHLSPLLGEIAVNAVDGDHLNHLCFHGLNARYDHCGDLSTKSRIDLIRTLNDILRFGFEHRYLSQRIRIDTPKASRPKMKVLREDEQIKLEQVLRADFPKRDALGIFICLYTGLRVGELCGLRWEDIDLSYGTLFVRRTVQRVSGESGSKSTVIIGPPKSTKSEREIPIPDHLLNMLKSLKKEHVNHYYLSNSERCFEPRRMQRCFSYYLSKAGLEHRGFHCTRHTFATRWVEAGLDIKTLSEILGHTSIRVTMDKYVHISEKTKRENINKIRPLG